MKTVLLAPMLCLALATPDACAGDAASTLDGLVAVTAERLALADEVAASKYVRGAAVLDSAREVQVIQAAVAGALPLGLPGDYVRQVIADQIEANKLIQYELLAEWRVHGNAPTAVIDLAGEIRPRLDRLQGELLQRLADVQPQRQASDCQLRLDRATFAYADKARLASLQRHALLRALVDVCAAPPAASR